MKKRLLVFVLVVLFLFPATLAMGNDDGSEFDPSGLFVPDITEAVFESALTVEDTGVVELSLPELQAFWVDLVNKERVTESGEGVYVAVLDTGLLPQWPFFFSEANIAMEYCKGFSHDITWNNDLFGIEISPVKDDRGCITDLASGHGTHVASTVVGFNFNNLAWVSGVAPEATIIPVLVLDAWLVDSPFGTLPFSGGTDAMIAAGINYVADLSETLDGPVVINMSLGGPNPEPLIEAAVDYAISKGVIVVASAGNNGTDGMGYPGGLNQIISAGAAGYAQMFDFGWTNDVPENLKSQDSLGNTFHVYLEDFSSRPVMEPYDQKHQNLDVSAPGAWVVGPYKSAFANNTSYYYLSGTSMAAPHVSAIAALVLENHPDLTQTEMEFILSLGAQSFPLPASDAVVSFPFTSAGYYTATWDGGDYGAGFLQAPSAIQFAKTLGK